MPIDRDKPDPPTRTAGHIAADLRPSDPTRPAGLQRDLAANERKARPDPWEVNLRIPMHGADYIRSLGTRNRSAPCTEVVQKNRLYRLP